MFLALVVASAFSLGDPSEMPSYSEAAAAYRQNMESGLPLMVEWTVTDYELPAAIELDLANIEVLKQAMNSGKLDANIRPSIAAKIESTKGSVDEDSREVRLRHKTQRFLFWTDGVLIHNRVRGGDVTKSLLDEFEGPLEKAQLSTRIYSFDPGRTPKLKVWQGLATDGKTLTGYIGEKDVGGLTDRSFLPPLGTVKSEWKRSQRHSSLDIWTDFSPSLDRTILRTDEPYSGLLEVCGAFGGDDSNSGVKRVIAIFDDKQGYIPKSVTVATSSGPLSIDPPKDFPVRLSETLQIGDIQEVEGFYYPKKITHTKYAVKPEWYAKNPAMADPHTEIPYVPISVRVEEVLAIKPRFEISRDWKDLKFPAGTRYMDMDTKEMYLEGSKKEEYDRQLVKELTQGTGADPEMVSLNADSRGSYFWVFAAINTCAVLVLVVIFRYTRKRSKMG